MTTTTATRERPILFTPEMVRAILDGRKTQTRRVVKPQPLCGCSERPEEMCRTTPEGWQAMGHSGQWWCPCCTGDWRARCPYGATGDLLWVREAFYIDHTDYSEGGRLPREMPPHIDRDFIYYRAEGECCQQFAECACDEVGKPRWRPSIHMPRWASRLTLRVTEVRVQRVQEISEADAIAEGVERGTAIEFDDDCNPLRWGWRDYGPTKYASGPGNHLSARGSFRSLWDSINAARGFGWHANPWVWAVGFEIAEARP